MICLRTPSQCGECQSESFMDNATLPFATDPPVIFAPVALLDYFIVPLICTVLFCSHSSPWVQTQVKSLSICHH